MPFVYRGRVQKIESQGNNLVKTGENKASGVVLLDYPSSASQSLVNLEQGNQQLGLTELADETGLPAAGGGDPLIEDVPAYYWTCGCVTTAATMAVGYWDAHGFDNLIPGSNSWTENNQVIVNLMIDLGLNHCGIMFGCGPGGGGGGTGSSPGQCFESWVRFKGYTENFTIGGIGGNFTTQWNNYKTEIDAGRPVVLLVDCLGGWGYTNHGIIAIGYDDTNPAAPMYAMYNTWDFSVHWVSFTRISDFYNTGNSNPAWSIGSMEAIHPFFPPHECGNNIREVTELCDGTDVPNFNCPSKACAEDCKSCLPESKIINEGNLQITGYLVMKVQKNIGGSWTDYQTIADETTPRTVEPSPPGSYASGRDTQLKLDSIWNSANVRINEPGAYRAYASFNDATGQPIRNKYPPNPDHTYLTSTWNFNVA